MTSQQMIELVIEQSSVDKGSIAQIYLEKAMVEFCTETGMIKKRGTFTVQTKEKFHTLGITDMINIRRISQDGIIFDNTELPSYLEPNNGFWYVESTDGANPTIALGYWNGTDESYFDANETFDILYEATVPLVTLNGEGNPDYTLEVGIPERWHDAIVARASEKANLVNPNLRSYYYSVWKDELKKAKMFANSKNTDAPYNIKVYTL